MAKQERRHLPKASTKLVPGKRYSRRSLAAALGIGTEAFSQAAITLHGYASVLASTSAIRGDPREEEIVAATAVDRAVYEHMRNKRELLWFRSLGGGLWSAPVIYDGTYNCVRREGEWVLLASDIYRALPGDASAVVSDIDEIRRRKIKATTKKALIDARQGQGAFRRELLVHWNCCPVSGMETELLLRASHIKPWSACTDRERLDPNNGVLLAAHIDAAFDEGLIGFDNEGGLLVSKRLNPRDARRMGIRRGMHVSFSRAQLRYLQYHRKKYDLK